MISSVCGQDAGVFWLGLGRGVSQTPCSQPSVACGNLQPVLGKELFPRSFACWQHGLGDRGPRSQLTAGQKRLGSLPHGCSAR